MKKYKYVSESTQIFEEGSGSDKAMMTTIEIIRSGMFNHRLYGKVDISKKYLDTIVNNWKNNVFPTQVSFDRDHNPASGAMAWVPTPEMDSNALYLAKKKYKDPQGVERSCHVLMAKVELTDEGYSLIKSKKYKYFSSEINPNYKSYEVFNSEFKDAPKEEGAEYGPVLISGGLTNRPYIVNLQPISLSFSSDLSADDETEDSYRIKAYGNTDELMMFSSSFGDQVEEDDDEDKAEQVKEESSDDSSKNEYENSEVGQSGVSATDAGNSQFSTPLETHMKLSEILVEVAGKSTTLDQIAVIEQYSTAAAGDDKIVLDSFLNSKRDLLLKEKESAQLEQKRKSKEDEVAALQERVISLSVIAEQNKQMAYAQRVEVFCNTLEKDKHYPGVISEVKEILCSVSAGQREQKFSCLFADKTEDLDMFSIVTRILSALPDDARFVESTEQFSASGESSTASSEIKVETAKPEAKVAADKYDLFFSKWGADFTQDFSSAEDLRSKSAVWDSKITVGGDYNLGATYTKPSSNDI